MPLYNVVQRPYARLTSNIRAAPPPTVYAEVPVTGIIEEQDTPTIVPAEVHEDSAGNETTAQATPDLEVIDVTPPVEATQVPADTAAAAQAADETPTTPASEPRSLTALAWIALVVVAATVAVAGYAFFVSTQESELAPRGVAVAGLELGGLTRAGVREAISNDVADRTTAEVLLHYGDGQWPVTLEGFADVDVDQAVGDVFSVRDETPLLDLIRHDLLGEPIEREFDYRYTIDRDALLVTVGAIADGVNTDMVNARLKLRDGHPVWEPGRDGVAVDEEKTITELIETFDELMALPAPDRANSGEPLMVDVQTSPIPRERTVDDLKGRAIKVDLSDRSLTLYDPDGVMKTWRVATGAPGFPTPEGNFRIVLKRYMPTWGNPGSAWAADMPAFIPPGPTNPLGLRALNLNAPGIRIHGTSNLASIGTAASHGCVRMANENIVELYDMVEVGTPVFIVE